MCNLVAWFQFEYRKDEPNDEDISYLSIGDLHKDFIQSDIYLSLSRKEQYKFSRNKFFEIVRKKIFFRKYYIKNYNSIRYVLNGWYKQVEINM